MKRIVAILVLAASSALADPTPSILHTDQTYGLLPWSRSMDIDRDGQVIVTFSCFGQGPDSGNHVFKAMALEPDEFAVLLGYISMLDQSPLVDLHPEDPMCTDGGGTTYTAMRQDQVPIIILQDQACHHLRQQTVAAEKLIEHTSKIQARADEKVDFQCRWARF